MHSYKPTLVCISPAQIPEIWPHIVPFIDRACARYATREERASIGADLIRGIALAWVAWSDERQIEAVLVTDLIKEDGALVCRLRALCGRHRKRWMPLLQQIEDYAKTEGCRAVRYVGRAGWKSALPDYRITHIHGEKRLT